MHELGDAEAHALLQRIKELAVLLQKPAEFLARHVSMEEGAREREGERDNK
jgi:hypothetical protein